MPGDLVSKRNISSSQVISKTKITWIEFSYEPNLALRLSFITHFAPFLTRMALIVNSFKTSSKLKLCLRHRAELAILRSALQTQKFHSSTSHQKQVKQQLLQPMLEKAGDPVAVLDHLGNLVEVTLTVQYHQSTEDSNTKEILFQVCDRGQGIPADRLESIFERFHQVDSSDSRKKGGTGLGLAICRTIIEQHEGKIWAKSILGEGSIFSFTLPILRT